MAMKVKAVEKLLKFAIKRGQYGASSSNAEREQTRRSQH